MLESENKLIGSVPPPPTDMKNYDSHYHLMDIERIKIDSFKAKGEVIKSLISALGTMVQEPEFETDPNNIGRKQFKMYIQRPILNGEDRNKVLNKLVSLIDGI